MLTFNISRSYKDCLTLIEMMIENRSKDLELNVSYRVQVTPDDYYISGMGVNKLQNIEMKKFLRRILIMIDYEDFDAMTRTERKLYQRIMKNRQKEGNKFMKYERFKTIIDLLQKYDCKININEYLKIDDLETKIWKDLDEVPKFYALELISLMERKEFEFNIYKKLLCSSADSENKDHMLALLNGTTHHLDEDKMQSKEAITEFVKNQIWVVKQEINNLIEQDYDENDCKKLVSDIMLSTHDISDLEFKNEELREFAKETRADAVLDLEQYVECLFEDENN